MKLLRSKTKKDKMQTDLPSLDMSQRPKIELERLCSLKNRLDNLKQRLLRFQPSKSKARGRSKCQSEPSVIFVPVAVVREKKA